MICDYSLWHWNEFEKDSEASSANGAESDLYQDIKAALFREIVHFSRREYDLDPSLPSDCPLARAQSKPKVWEVRDCRSSGEPYVGRSRQSRRSEPQLRRRWTRHEQRLVPYTTILYILEHVRYDIAATWVKSSLEQWQFSIRMHTSTSPRN